MAKNLCIKLCFIDEKDLSDQDEPTEEDTFTKETFISIDEIFALNATSMLDQPNTSIKRKFCMQHVKKIQIYFLMQKNPRVEDNSSKQH